jgi:hypothetical protein
MHVSAQPVCETVVSRFSLRWLQGSIRSAKLHQGAGKSKSSSRRRPSLRSQYQETCILVLGGLVSGSGLAEEAGVHASRVIELRLRCPHVRGNTAVLGPSACLQGRE